MGEEVFYSVKGISENKLEAEKNINKVIFQDLGLGNSMIVNSIEVWQGLNLSLIILIWISLIGYFIYNYFNSSIPRGNRQKLLKGFGIILGTILLSVLFSIFYAGLFISISNLISPLRYYSNPPLFIATLVSFSLQGNVFIFWLFSYLSKKYQFSLFQDFSPRAKRNFLHVAIIFFMSIIDFILVITGLFGYFMLYFFFWILFSTIGFCCMILVEKCIQKVKHKDVSNLQINPSLQNSLTQTLDSYEMDQQDDINEETSELIHIPQINNDNNNDAGNGNLLNQNNQLKLVDLISLGIYSLITFSLPWIMTLDYLWFQSSVSLPTLGENGFFSITGGFAVYLGICFPILAFIVLLFHLKVLYFVNLSLFIPCIIFWIVFTLNPQFSPSTPAKIDAYQYMISNNGFLGSESYQSYFMLRSKMLQTSQMAQIAIKSFPGAEIDCDTEMFYSDDADYDDRCSISLPELASIPTLPQITFQKSFDDSFETTDVFFRVEAQGSSIIRIEINSTLLSWSLNETQFSGEYRIVNIERINAWKSIDWTFSLQLQGEISSQHPIEIKTYIFYDEQSYGNYYWKDFINSLEDSITTFSSGTGLVRLKTLWTIT